MQIITDVTDPKTHTTLPYSAERLNASLYAVCLKARTPAGAAKMTADCVCREIAPWLATKQEVTSADIRRKAGERLKIHNPKAALLYLKRHMLR